MAININLQGLEIVGNQSNLTFNQIDANLSLPDFQVRAIYPSYQPTKLRVEMSIIDNQNNLITDSEIMLIQSGIAKSGVQSQFKDGIWSAEGSMADINDLLRGNKIEIGENFNDPVNDINNLFKILLTLKDLSNSNYSNQSTIKKEIALNYQCLELPEDIIAIIDSQKSEVDKKIIMDFVRYFNNPEDKRFESAIAELKQIDNLNNSLNIEKINQTAFSIIGDKYGDYPLKLSLTGKCQEILNREFNLTLNALKEEGQQEGQKENQNQVNNTTTNNTTNTTTNQNSNPDYLMIGSISGVGALLLACSVLYYCNKRKKKTSPVLEIDLKEIEQINQQDNKEQQSSPKSSPSLLIELNGVQQLGESANFKIELKKMEELNQEDVPQSQIELNKIEQLQRQESLNKEEQSIFSRFF